MEIETKIENQAVKKRLFDLDSENPEIIKEAVNYLSRQDKNKQLKNALREIVENHWSCENCAAIWAIVILGIMRDQDAIPYLLEIFESDEDFAEEAAMDALILIEKAHPDSAVPAVFEFIEDRILNDPNRAKIFASGVLEPFVEREPVKSFLIKLFEGDREAQDYIGGILTNTKDKRILELFKRSLVFAEQSGASDFATNEAKWHYYYLANGVSYAEKYPENQNWKENWETRWEHLFERMLEDEEDGQEDEEAQRIAKEKFEKFKKDIDKDGEFKKELAARDAQVVAPFSLERWLEIRQRSDFENEFQLVLDLIGAGDLWQVEDLQKMMNESRSTASIIKMVSEKINFPSEKSFAVFCDYATRLWNATPREELDGLSPNEKMEVYLLGQE